ncbi:MAG: hypothetical protein JSW25_07450 [Thermoplasmata archaeon]|nr:MAG: hypothetical protein JSW25_07450 [Thermoplasmata archaeon]
MDAETYHERVEEMKALLKLGRTIDADMTKASSIFREALFEYSEGNDRATRDLMDSAREKAMRAVDECLRVRLETTRSRILRANKAGVETGGASELLVHANNALAVGNASDAIEYDRKANETIASAWDAMDYTTEQLSFSGWLIEKLSFFDFVPEHIVDAREASMKAAVSGNLDRARDIDLMLQGEMIPLLQDHIADILAAGQRQVIYMRQRDVDPARPSMSISSAADYLEMARRRFDRGTPDDIRAALEYLYELETRYAPDDA